MTGMLPRWDTYEIMEATAHPELIGLRLTTLVADQRRTTPFDVVLDLALDEPELGLRVRRVVANDDVDGIRMLLGEDNCTLGLSDAGAHVGQLCDAPMATDLWVTGCVIARRCRSKRPSASSAACRPTCSASRTVATFVKVHSPTCSCSISTPSGPARCVASATSPPTPSASPRMQPTGMRHVLVNGTPIQSDGSVVAAGHESRPGQLARPSTR